MNEAEAELMKLSKIVDGVPVVSSKLFHLTCGYKIIKATSAPPVELFNREGSGLNEHST